jgi:hypothetical protein
VFPLISALINNNIKFVLSLIKVVSAYLLVAVKLFQTGIRSGNFKKFEEIELTF